MQSNDEKEILERNLMYLNEPSLFTYSEGDGYELGKVVSLNVSMAQIEDRIIRKNINISDCFIALAVAKMGVSNRGMIINYLRYYHRLYPYKAIPYNVKPADIKGRLDVLCRSGILREFTIKRTDTKTKKSIFYGISEYGVQIIKKVLDIERISYDCWTSADCEPRILKRVAASYLLSTFLASESISKVKFYTQVYSKREHIKRQIYGSAEFTSSDGNATMVYVEPVFYHHNAAIKSDDEVIEDIKSRLIMLQDMVLDVSNDDNSKYSKVLVYFLVEDSIGLKKTAKLIKEYAIKLFDFARFSSETVLYNNKEELAHSFFIYEVIQDKGTLTIDSSDLYK